MSADVQGEKSDNTIHTYLMHIFPENVVCRGEIELPDDIFGHHDVDAPWCWRRGSDNALTNCIIAKNIIRILTTS